jgi:S-adenosyl methyltransferase
VTHDDEGARRAKAALVDTSVPNPARVGDYLYGGRNNFEVDRKAARSMIAVAPSVAAIAPAARAFRQRVVRYLVGQAGVTQFLDIGTGLAVAGNTHDVAQSIDPRCRIVYADSDPVVLAHARALIRSAPEGAISCLDAEGAGEILAEARATLDFGQPVAFLLLSTLAFLPDIAAAGAMVRTLLDAGAAGSHLALYHQASDLDPAFRLAATRWNRQSQKPVTLRSHDEVAGLLAGLDVLSPGVVPICEWRPEPGDPKSDQVVPFYGALARKP